MKPTRLIVALATLPFLLFLIPRDPWRSKGAAHTTSSACATQTALDSRDADAASLRAFAEQVPSTLNRMPLAFVENRGQWDPPARFIARRGGTSVHVEPNAFTTQLLARGPAFRNNSRQQARGPLEDAPPRLESISGVNLRFQFEGAAQEARIRPENPLVTSYNFYTSPDPARWREGIPAYERVRWENLYDGTDLVLREGDFHLEYDLVLRPGADLEAVSVRVDGISAPILVDEGGSLTLPTALGDVRQVPPRTWQETPDGQRDPVDSRYRLLGPDLFGFEVSDWNRDMTLVIDPGLIFSTFIGGANEEFQERGAMAVRSDDVVVVSGVTISFDFPVTPGAFDVTLGGAPGCCGDAFVAFLAPSGDSLLFCTYLGGSDADSAHGVAVDAAGAAIVVGLTRGPGFPSTAALGPLGALYGNDGFVTKLSAVGTLIYSTKIGGDGSDEASAAVPDADGAVTIVGTTSSSNFPTTAGAFDQTQNGGAGDAFIARLSPSGDALLYSTYLGGSGLEKGVGLAVDAAGAVVVAGRTGSTDFPTSPGAFDQTFNGGEDVFVAKMSPDGSALLFGTYVGGSDLDQIERPVVDGSGSVTLAGLTLSSDFPVTAGAFDTTYGGGIDIVVLKLSPGGDALVYSTFLGGAGEEQGSLGDLDSSGAPVLAGLTSSQDFPTTQGAFDSTFNGGADIIVVKMSADGSELVYATFVGGPEIDRSWNLHLDSGGNAVVAGDTRGSFPTSAGAFDTTFNGGADVVVFKIALPVVETIDITSPASGSTLRGLVPVTVAATGLSQVEFLADTFSFAIDPVAPFGADWDTALFPDGSIALRALGTKTSGGLIEDSVPVTIDNTSPTFAFTSPPAGSLVRGTIELTATASDPSGISQVCFFVGSTIIECDITDPYVVHLDTTAYADGSLPLSATATDGVGNQASESLSVIVDNTLPTVIWTSPADGIFVSGSVPLTVEVTDAHPVSVKFFTGGNLVAVDTTPGDGFAGSVNTSAFPDGPLALEALARDGAGNEAAAEITVLVDNTAPSKILSSPPDGSTISGTITVQANVEDGGSGVALVAFFLNDVQVATDSTPDSFGFYDFSFDSAQILDGALRIGCAAFDNVGNSAVDESIVTVDNVAVSGSPTTLNLKSSGKDKSVTVHLDGTAAQLLIPVEGSDLTLAVPGGPPVPATTNWPGDDQLGDGNSNGIPDLTLKFDRVGLISSFRQAGAPTPSLASLAVKAGQQEIGTFTIRVIDP